MKIFIWKLVLFLGFMMLMTLVLGSVYFFYEDISWKKLPSPAITESVSFNEKLAFLRKKRKKAAVIAIGSSISLNNLSSSVINNNLPTPSFLNTASWGMPIKNTFYLLKVWVDIYHPETVIMTSNIADFTLNPRKENYSSLKNYLNSGPIVFSYYQLVNTRWRNFISDYKYAQKVRNCGNDYEFLGYDAYGTVNYDSTQFHFNLTRWNTDYLSGEVEPETYSYFDSISFYCNENHIQLLFFQSPYRSGLYTSLGELKKHKLKSHLSKIETILKKRNQVYVDGNKILWKDFLFVDGVHFNKYGAQVFTEYCLNEIHK